MRRQYHEGFGEWSESGQNFKYLIAQKREELFGGCSLENGEREHLDCRRGVLGSITALMAETARGPARKAAEAE